MTTSIDTINLDSGASLEQPDISRLTTNSISGTGVFDVLMQTVSKHLIEEYESDRITGSEYTQVYLGALSSTLQASIQFLLNTQQEIKIQAETALVRQRTVTELAQTDDSLPVGLGFNGDTTVEGLVKLQKDKFTKESELIDSQIEQTTASVKLTGQQIVTELLKTGDDISDATSEGYGFNSNSAVEGVIQAELSKIQSDEDLVTQKIVTEVANTSDTKPADLGKMTGTTEIHGLVTSQKYKLDAEQLLLRYKGTTEVAQTMDTVPAIHDAGGNLLPVDVYGTPYSVAGVIGKQKSLYTAQTDGFTRDAEQKVLKILADTWSISATQGEATANTTNHLDDSSLGAVVTKAKNGIGIT